MWTPTFSLERRVYLADGWFMWIPLILAKFCSIVTICNMNYLSYSNFWYLFSWITYSARNIFGNIMRYIVSTLLYWYNQIPIDSLLFYIFHYSILSQKVIWIPGTSKWKFVSPDIEVICKIFIMKTFYQCCISNPYYMQAIIKLGKQYRAFPQSSIL